MTYGVFTHAKFRWLPSGKFETSVSAKEWIIFLGGRVRVTFALKRNSLRGRGTKILSSPNRFGYTIDLFSDMAAVLNYFDLRSIIGCPGVYVHISLCSANCSAIFLFTTKTTQLRPQVFSVNGALTCNCAALLVNSSWLCWIMYVLLSNQRRRNILNE